MAAIDFPASPTTGQLFSAANGVTYQYNGTLWLVIAGPGGGTGDVSAYMNGALGFGTTAVAIAVFDTVRSGNAGGWLNLSNGRYTPPAGRYYLSAMAGFNTSGASGSTLVITLRKNGVDQAQNSVTVQGAGWTDAIGVDAVLDANGTDYFEVALNASIASVITTNAKQVTFTAFPLTGMQGPAGPDSKLLQTVMFQTGAAATGTGLIPIDDTIPQITEGNEYMTLAITPRSAASKLIIEVIGVFGTAVAGQMVMALFQDSTANALAVTAQLNDTTQGRMLTIPLRHTMTSGTTSATTFRVRAGQGNANTTTFNGTSSVRQFGGVMASSIVIQEVAP